MGGRYTAVGFKLKPDKSNIGTACWLPLGIGTACWLPLDIGTACWLLLVPADEVASATGATNGLGDRELENPAPLGLRPRFNDPRGRPRLDDGIYCWSRLLLERTEVKYGVVIWAEKTCEHQQRQILHIACSMFMVGDFGDLLKIGGHLKKM